MTKKKAAKQKGKSTKKIKLPASGLASDVLDAEPATGDTSAPVVESGTEDIYAFAENLNREQEDKADEDASKGPLETWVTFSTESETYALPVSQVQEILRVGTITRVPQAPASVRGITNVRGRVIPVVDFRVRLGLDPVEINGECRILVIESKTSLIGFLVESVQQVIRLRRSEMQEAPADIITEQSDFYLGVVQQDDRLLIILDPDRVIRRESAAVGAA